MNLIISLLLIGVCTSTQLHQSYLPPNVASGSNSGFPGTPSRPIGISTGINGAPRTSSGGANSGGSGGGTGSHEGGGGFRPQDAGAQILSQFSDVTSEGRFSYHFETSNGIKASEAGLATNGVQAQGEFSYTGDDGQLYKITYTADENGYIPVGAHLPTSPPVPEDILRSLEQNAKDEASGIFNEGSYHEDLTNSGSSGQNSASTYGGSGTGYAPGQPVQPSYNPSTGYKY